MPSNHLILCHPLLLLSSIFPSIRVLSNESVPRIGWPKYWSFSFSISTSNEYSGLISFRMNWLDLLSVQGTLKSLLQHHSSKASILQCSSFFTVQLSHPYMTTGKTITMTRQTFVGKVMSLLFNTLFRLVITFLSRSKHFLTSWLQSTYIHISILPQTPLPPIQQTIFFIHLRELNFHSQKIFIAMLPSQSNACYTCFMCSCNLCVFLERPEGTTGDKLTILRPLKALDLFFTIYHIKVIILN